MNVLNVLQEGEANALTAKELQEILGYKHVRDVTAEVHRLRASDIVILSGNSPECSGYFLPANREEVERYLRSMYSRMRQTKIACLSAEDYVKQSKASNEVRL